MFSANAFITVTVELLIILDYTFYVLYCLPGHIGRQALKLNMSLSSGRRRSYRSDIVMVSNVCRLSVRVHLEN